VGGVPSATPVSSVRWATVLPPGSRLHAASIAVDGDLVLLSTTLPATGPGGLPAAVFQSGSSATGRLAREVVVPRAVSQPFLAGAPATGTVLVPTLGDDPARRELRALDATSGAVRWVVPAELGGDPSGGAYFHPAGQDGMSVVGQVLGTSSVRQSCGLCAVDLTSGRVRWRIRATVAASGRALGAVVVAHDRTAAVIGTREAAILLVVESETGREVFRRDTSWSPNAMWPSVMRCGPLVLGVAGRSDTSAVVTAYDGSGDAAWARTVAGPPIVDRFSGTVVLADADGGIEAIACDNGGVRWSWTPGRVAEDQLVLTGARSGYVIGNAGAVVVAFDVLTGRPVWHGSAAADNPGQWTGRSYVAWRDDSTLVAYAGAREPVAVTMDDGREHPVFLPS
jgi:outer membrane protein assembly factor BamB